MNKLCKFFCGSALIAAMAMSVGTAQAAPKAFACGCIEPDTVDFSAVNDACSSPFGNVGLGGMRVRAAIAGDTADEGYTEQYPSVIFDGCDYYIDRKPVCASPLKDDDGNPVRPLEAYVCVGDEMEYRPELKVVN